MSDEFDSVLNWYKVSSVDELVKVCLASLRGKDLMTQLQQQSVALIARNCLEKGSLSDVPGKDRWRFVIHLPEDKPSDQNQDIHSVAHEFGHTFEFIFEGQMNPDAQRLRYVETWTGEVFANLFAICWLEEGTNSQDLLYFLEAHASEDYIKIPSPEPMP
ncbi:hypothetical protein KW782_04490 [Candidatus Parcubacteria bacterium]|nr:hypothetical protein [Candidatus Parcubacteria bacterium]